jgi:crotonobetainyl-CoA:carnitine CoA-transferase CaiB-like acyl-CoA transferase
MENITKNKLNAEFIDIMSAAIEQKTAAEWAEIFTANEIPFSVAQVWEEVLEDKQAWASDVFLQDALSQRSGANAGSSADFYRRLSAGLQAVASVRSEQ